MKHPEASSSGNLLPPLYQKGQGKRLLPKLMTAIDLAGPDLPVGTVTFIRRKHPLPNCEAKGTQGDDKYSRFLPCHPLILCQRLSLNESYRNPKILRGQSLRAQRSDGKVYGVDLGEKMKNIQHNLPSFVPLHSLLALDGKFVSLTGRTHKIPSAILSSSDNDNPVIFPP